MASKKLNVPAFTSSKELEVAKKLLVMPDEDYSIMFDNIFQRSGIPREQKQEMLGATRLYKNKVFNLPDFKIISEGFEIESNEGMWKVRTDVGHSPEHISLTDKKRSLYLLEISYFLEYHQMFQTIFLILLMIDWGDI